MEPIIFSVNNEQEWDAAVAYLKNKGYRWNLIGKDLKYPKYTPNVGGHPEDMYIYHNWEAEFGTIPASTLLKQNTLKWIKENL